MAGGLLHPDAGRAQGQRGHRPPVWACDSFEGLPRPDDAAYPADEGDPHHTFPALAVPLEQVRANFAAYGLLDGQVRFVPGFFRDTLPGLDTGPPALLRLDGDMYGSTAVALDSLYPRLSPGGVVVIDDMALGPCAQAVRDVRARHGIEARVHEIDWTGVWWRTPGDRCGARPRRSSGARVDTLGRSPQLSFTDRGGPSAADDRGQSLPA